MADMPHDERRQLARLRSERDRLINLYVKISLFLFAILAGSMLLGHFFKPLGNFDLPPYITVKNFVHFLIAFSVVLAFIVMNVAIPGRLKAIKFDCPNTRCHGAPPAGNWKCSCGHVHIINWFNMVRFSKELKVLGEPCYACKEMASHCICPDCNTTDLA